jgi:hypothetical protein
VSDATLEVVERDRHAWERLDEVAPEAHLVLRTDRVAHQRFSDTAAQQICERPRSP